MADDEKSRREETDRFGKWIISQHEKAPPLTEDLADLFPDEFEYDDDEDDDEDKDDNQSSDNNEE